MTKKWPNKEDYNQQRPICKKNPAIYSIVKFVKHPLFVNILGIESVFVQREGVSYFDHVETVFFFKFTVAPVLTYSVYSKSFFIQTLESD